MTPDRWRAARTIFEAVMEMNRDQEQRYLDEHCAADEELRSEVLSLLQAYRGSEDFMETPWDLQRQQLDLAGVDSLIGRHLGSYRIVSPLGHGGMGEVYLAVRADDEYVQQVAIKIVPSGMNTELWLARFRYERQLLASLEHPNIARLLDGGTIDGRPYFVMEHIDGMPIDEYAADHQLSLDQRLHLFQEVCKAVHFAHQNLIVHRDIKPANVLVTRQGVPKLLDFGIAKLTDPSDHGGQQTAFALMTPQYASPEQVRKESVTTASDIYSLGVLLYELLTTRMPYTATSADPFALARAICEEAPLKPQLNGDIDNILFKTLQKEPGRRYASALELENDIDRYLRGLPVAARGDSLGYRARKFVSRHRLASSVACAAALLTLAAGAFTWGQYRVAQRERQAAEQRFNDVRSIADTLLSQVDSSIADLPGATAARQTLAKTALDHLDRLYQDSGRNPDIQRELAGAYEKMAAIFDSPGLASLGGVTSALQLWSKALSLREARASELPSDLDARKEWAESLAGYSSRMQQKDTQKAQELAAQAVALLESVRATKPSIETTRSLARTYYQLGSASVAAGNLNKSLAAFDQSIALLQEILRADPSDDQVRRSIALTNKRVGAQLGMNKQIDAAFARYQSALETERVLLAKNPTKVQPRRDLSVTYSDLGWLHYTGGDIPGAFESYSEALKIRQQLADADPANVDMRGLLASTHSNLAAVSSDLKNWTRALEHNRKALELRMAISAADPANLRSRADVAISHDQAADIDLAAGKLQQAIDSYQRAVTIRRDLVQTDPASRDYKAALGFGYLKLGKAYHQLALHNAPLRCEMLENAGRSFAESTQILGALKEKGQIFQLETQTQAKYQVEIQAVDIQRNSCTVKVSGSHP